MFSVWKYLLRKSHQKGIPSNQQRIHFCISRYCKDRVKTEISFFTGRQHEFSKDWGLNKWLEQSFENLQWN